MAKLKARYWSSILYPENMIDDWQEVIGDVLQLPYAYCIHDKDFLAEYQGKKGEEYQRKVHVHLIIAFNNTTTDSSALDLVNCLSKHNCKCASTIQMVKQVRNAYEYLIHNTETSIKQKKYAYSPSERICGNNFDIGQYEQLALADKKRMRKELSMDIISYQFVNYLDFYSHVVSNYDDEYEDIVTTYSGHFERLTKGNYQKMYLISKE